ncbi:Nudix family hydrolase [Marinimicrobium sp. C6131]|uniref:Nudix family hydrolase n=1 Tax=Marinimicrobium sp. C6131 TaxID=3022676 RepID=UPI00223E5F5A|nr:Nudix family hydrolase [Marinimicrobium sp. C6131]UZJ46071.1 Nudix family hydrolase [Marinimicrobium sp. C6131]
MARVVRVAVGVIQDPEGRILIARRPDHVHQGGLWEFPGGKVDEGESLRDALVRELEEELSIQVRASEPLIDIRHDYPDKSVLLQVCRVTAFEGEPRGNEGQPVRWVAPGELPEYRFPEANRPILHAIRLPQQILITGPAESDTHWWQRLERAVVSGQSWVHLRAPELTADEYRARALQARTLCNRFGATLIAHGPEDRCLAELAGWHMDTGALWRCARRPPGLSGWWGASCHTPEELAKAVRLGVDYLFLSPVQPTGSHPGVTSLGWERFAQWVAGVPSPVYALGGVGPEALPQAKAAGAQGIAGIRYAW